MINDMYCPKCKYEFECCEWDDGECPKCGNKFMWSEHCTEDYSDSWYTILWESNNYEY